MTADWGISVSSDAFDSDAYIDEAFAAHNNSRPSPSLNRPHLIGACRWCECVEHGLRCTSCSRCESSYSSRDDSWRPRIPVGGLRGQQLGLMDKTGVDGYVATSIIVQATGAMQRERSVYHARMRNLLLGIGRTTTPREQGRRLVGTSWAAVARKRPRTPTERNGT